LTEEFVQRLFPIYVKLEGRSVLVIGAGTVGEEKIRGLLDTGAQIRVVALRASERVREWAKSGAVTLEEHAFRPADLNGIFLVIVAASSSVNELVFLEAKVRGILCNVVDVPQQCDFFYPAVVRRGDLQIAISTGGQSPSLAQKLRQQLERQFGPGYADWVAELGKTRRDVLRSNLEPEEKRFLLQSLASQDAFQAMVSAKRIQKPEGEGA
jgi:precorrin-2 dehydrogenase / sirohydrochlorin ferrochelatase